MTATVYSSRQDRHLPAVEVRHLTPGDRVYIGGHLHQVESVSPNGSTADVRAIHYATGESRRCRLALGHRLGRESL